MLPREILTALDEANAELPPKIRRAALKHGKGIVPALCRMLESPSRSRRSGGFGEIHAMTLLRQLGATEAIPSLLALLHQADFGEKRREMAIRALLDFGRPSFIPALAEPPGSDAFEAARVDVLAGLGVRDPRILALLLATLERSPAEGASLLGRYGDPDALPALSAALDRAPVAEGDLFNTDLAQLALAIEALGGELTEAQRAKLALEEGLAEKRREDFRRQLVDASADPEAVRRVLEAFGLPSREE